MPFKDSAQRRSYQKKYHEGWYATNGDHRRQQVKDRRRALRIRFRAYKESLCCHNCGLDGKDNSWALDFHHVCEPEEKISTIAHLVSSGYSWDKIMSEIDKCVVVCANCHRKEHWDEYKAKVAAGISPINHLQGKPVGQKKRRRRKKKERARAKERNDKTDASRQPQ